MEPFQSVSVQELPADAVILDVREDDEWQAGHIDGATHIPIAEIPQRFDEVPEAEALYLVCRGGGRSAQVAVWLNANGIPAVNVDGGMIAWAAASKPMTTDTGTPPAVL